jgi:hypothetical protein
MDTSLDLIRAKITELEGRLASLRIAEREILELDGAPARRAPVAPKSAVKTAPEPATESDSEPVTPPHQTIGATITDCLGEHGALSVPALAERITARGREINNRAISFALQALKKRGLVKSANGEWALAKRTRRVK